MTKWELGTLCVWHENERNQPTNSQYYLKTPAYFPLTLRWSKLVVYIASPRHVVSCDRGFLIHDVTGSLTGNLRPTNCRRKHLTCSSAPPLPSAAIKRGGEAGAQLVHLSIGQSSPITSPRPISGEQVRAATRHTSRRVGERITRTAQWLSVLLWSY